MAVPRGWPCHDQTFAELGVEFRCQAAVGAVPRPAPTKHAPTPDLDTVIENVAEPPAAAIA
jgi:hypothetical protein